MGQRPWSMGIQVKERNMGKKENRQLIGPTDVGGYVADLMNEIDQYGMQGEAGHMLRHLGCVGPIPQ